MSILKIRRYKKPDVKYINLLIPRQVAEYINLYALANNMTRSLLIRKIIRNWINRNHSKSSEGALVEKVVETVHTRWLIERSRWPKELDDYIIDLEDELRKKMISESARNAIMEKFCEKNKEKIDPTEQTTKAPGFN